MSFRNYLNECINEEHRYHREKEDRVGVLVYDNMEELKSKVSSRGVKELEKAEKILDKSNPTEEELWKIHGTLFNYSTEEHWKK